MFGFPTKTDRAAQADSIQTVDWEIDGRRMHGARQLMQKP